MYVDRNVVWLQRDQYFKCSNVNYSYFKSNLLLLIRKN